MDSEQYQACIDECNACAAACNYCAAACLQEENVADMRECIRLDAQGHCESRTGVRQGCGPKSADDSAIQTSALSVLGPQAR